MAYKAFHSFTKRVKENLPIIDELEDIDETPDIQEYQQEEQPLQQEDPEDLLKDWFTMLCNDVTKAKFISGSHYHFGDTQTKNSAPSLYCPTDIHVVKNLYYGEFRITLTQEEALRLQRIFNKGFRDHYAHIFKCQVENLKYIEDMRRKQKNDRTWGSVRMF